MKKITSLLLAVLLTGSLSIASFASLDTNVRPISVIGVTEYLREEAKFKDLKKHARKGKNNIHKLNKIRHSERTAKYSHR